MPTATISLGNLGSTGQKIFGAQPYMQLGRNVAKAGDFNGDGIADFIISGNSIGNSALPGISFVLFGTASGVYPTVGSLYAQSPDRGFYILSGPGDPVGLQANAAGDVNGDGYDDLIIGTPRSDGPGSWAGHAYILYGHASGFGTVDLANLTPAYGARIYQSATSNAMLGGQVASAGDINGDGYDGGIIGALADDTGGTDRGRAYILYGKASGIGNIDVSTLTGAQGFYIQGGVNNTLAGYQVAGLGDLNGDGIDDIAISTTPLGGETYVIYGKTSGLSNITVPAALAGSQGFVIRNTADPKSVGSIAAAGDVNGDGYQDILVGSNSHEAYLIFGKAGGLGTVELSTLMATDGVKFYSNVFTAGNALAGNGDFNGDGYDDLVFGGPASFSEPGHGFVYFGHGGSFSTVNLDNLAASEGFGFAGEAAGDTVGAWISFAGDVNNDGTDELLIGASNSLSGNASGLTYLLYGTQAAAGGVIRTGTVASQSLAGGNDADFLYGLGGDDRLFGNSGDDVLEGGTGDDVLEGGAGVDRIYGGAGNDVIFLHTVSDLAAGEIIDGGADNDVLMIRINQLSELELDFSTVTFTGIEAIQASEFNTVLTFNVAQLSGVTSFSKVDLRIADAGTVTLGSNVTLDFMSHIYLSAAGNTLDLRGAVTFGGTAVFGGVGNDTVYGSDAGDTLFGGGGNDRLDGGVGDDQLIGGAGDDIYFVDANDVLVELAGEGTDTVNTSLNFYTLDADFENLIFTGTGNFEGYGNGLANVINATTAPGYARLHGLGGNDTLYGSAGADTLDGGTGADAMYGGAGDDTYYVDDLGDTANELAGGGTDLVLSTVNFTLSAELENLSLGGAAALIGTGNALANTITAGGQANTLYGLAGNDVLNGGAGADTMYGGADNDTYYVDNALDSVIEGLGAGTDFVKASASWTMGAGQEIEYLTTADSSDTVAINLTGNELANIIIGNRGANMLTGGGGNDQLNGGEGNDTLDGGTGADTMNGGAGADSYIVDNAGDTVFEAIGGGPGDTVTATVNWTLGAGQEIERLRAIGSITVTGNERDQKVQGDDAANTLNGGGGRDQMVGAGGDDVLNGGTGDDKLTGNEGADRFVFDVGTGTDRIKDFEVGIDKIDLRAFGVSWAQVQAAMTTELNSTIITLGNGDVVQVQNIANAALHQSDFILAPPPAPFVSDRGGASEIQMWDDGVAPAVFDDPVDALMRLHIEPQHQLSEWHMM